jgi:hypothetical protein
MKIIFVLNCAYSDALIVYNHRRPTGKSWKELGKGLHTLLKEESNAAEPGVVDDDEMLDFSEGEVYPI